MKWKGIIISVSMMFTIFIAGYILYVWNKPHRDVNKENGISISAIALFDSFQHNETAANKSFLNKTIQVSGKVSAIKINNASKTVVYLQSNDPIFGINCTFKDAIDSIKINDEIIFKGICTGYLDDVILNEGQLIAKR